VLPCSYRPGAVNSAAGASASAVLFRGDGVVDCERALALAVLEQAMQDCRDPQYHCELSQFHESWCFLTDHAGRWAQSRELWCDIAGVEPDFYRLRALRLVDYERSLAKVRHNWAARRRASSANGAKQRQAEERRQQIVALRDQGLKSFEIAIKIKSTRRHVNKVLRESRP
jgi:hypothetical protein